MTRWRMGLGIGVLSAVCALTMATGRASDAVSDQTPKSAATSAPFTKAPSPLAIGDRIEASLFCAQSDENGWRDSIKLIVLAPARSEYDGMLRLAFNEYFRKGDAFAHGALKTPIKVVHITGARAEAAGFMGDYLDSDCTPATDPQALAAIARATGVTLPLADDSDAIVLLLDRDGVLRWRDTAYRAQGEHLKPLEKTVKALLGAPDAVAVAAGGTAGSAAGPRVGDMAPDVEIALPPPPGSLDTLLAERAPRPTKTVPLSSLRGKVVLLTFYPAAFSGTLPTVQGSVADKIAAERKDTLHRMMMCSIQIDQLDSILIDRLDRVAQRHIAKDDIVKLAISASTPQLLDSWRRVLGTTDMRYVNDPDYAIAQRYGSYDAAAGYDMRKVFVIGRDGRIAYIDDDYAAGDGDAVQAALARAVRETSASR